MERDNSIGCGSPFLLEDRKYLRLSQESETEGQREEDGSPPRPHSKLSHNSVFYSPGNFIWSNARSCGGGEASRIIYLADINLCILNKAGMEMNREKVRLT